MESGTRGGKCDHLSISTFQLVEGKPEDPLGAACSPLSFLKHPLMKLSLGPWHPTRVHARACTHVILVAPVCLLDFRFLSFQHTTARRQTALPQFGVPTKYFSLWSLLGTTNKIYPSPLPASWGEVGQREARQADREGQPQLQARPVNSWSLTDICEAKKEQHL